MFTLSQEGLLPSPPPLLCPRLRPSSLQLVYDMCLLVFLLCGHCHKSFLKYKSNHAIYLLKSFYCFPTPYQIKFQLFSMTSRAQLNLPSNFIFLHSIPSALHSSTLKCVLSIEPPNSLTVFCLQICAVPFPESLFLIFY